MPKPIYKISKHDINLLKKSVIDKIGYPISTKKDCQVLSEMISSKNYGMISAATLYRLLLAPPIHIPYLHTLNILSVFLGHKSWHDLQIIFNKNPPLTIPTFVGESTTAYNNELLYQCLKHNSFKPVNDYFQEIHSQDNLFVKVELAISLFDGLLKNESNHSFFKEFSGNQLIRKYFFELCFDPCFRIAGYEYGLEQYIQNTPKNNTAEGFQDVVFANSVLFRHYYLNNHTRQAKETASQLYVKFEKKMEAMKSIHIYPYTRYLAYELFYHKMNHASKQTISASLEFILDFCSKVSDQKNKDDSRIVFHTVAETFTKCGLAESAVSVRLKNIFKEEFDNLPSSVFEKNLRQLLPYIDANGIMLWRPN